ncbi:MAG: hypothetical protein RLZZ152_1077 [Pseudomonadota bacterium]
MEAQDTTELMEQKAHGDKNQNRSALTISILAMVLAIASLGGSNAMKEATQENILAASQKYSSNVFQTGRCRSGVTTCARAQHERHRQGDV